MKKNFAALAFAGIVSTGAFAQDLKTADVPANVNSALMQKYPETAKAKVS